MLIVVVHLFNEKQNYMKKSAIIGGLLLSSCITIGANAAQPIKEQASYSQAERLFFQSFLADMRSPDDNWVHWSDNPVNNQGRERKTQAEWNKTYELTPAQAQIILDRMSDQLFLYREQKRQIYMILTEIHEPMYHNKGDAKKCDAEYIKFMKWKRREMDKKICYVLTEKQRQIYYRMKTDTSQYAMKIKK